MSVHKLELKRLTLYGFIHEKEIPLATFGLLDHSKRGETVEEILQKLASEDAVIFGDALIFTEAYDAFKVI